MSKTPFEIRQNLLETARSILHEQYEANMRTEEAKPHSERQTVKAPTTEEILAEAKKLNEFISEKGSKPTK